jgi:hypothetical protein
VSAACADGEPAVISACAQQLMLVRTAGLNVRATERANQKGEDFSLSDARKHSKYRTAAF